MRYPIRPRRSRLLPSSTSFRTPHILILVHRANYLTSFLVIKILLLAGTYVTRTLAAQAKNVGILETKIVAVLLLRATAQLVGFVALVVVTAIQRLVTVTLANVLPAPLVNIALVAMARVQGPALLALDSRRDNIG